MEDDVEKQYRQHLTVRHYYVPIADKEKNNEKT